MELCKYTYEDYDGDIFDVCDQPAVNDGWCAYHYPTPQDTPEAMAEMERALEEMRKGGE